MSHFPTRLARLHNRPSDLLVIGATDPVKAAKHLPSTVLAFRTASVRWFVKNPNSSPVTWRPVTKNPDGRYPKKSHPGVLFAGVRHREAVS